MSAKEGTLLGELREFLSSTAGKSQAALGVTPGPRRSPGSESKDDPKGRAIPFPPNSAADKCFVHRLNDSSWVGRYHDGFSATCHGSIPDW